MQQKKHLIIGIPTLSQYKLSMEQHEAKERADALSLFDCGVSCPLPLTVPAHVCLATCLPSVAPHSAFFSMLQVCLDTASEPVITFCGHLYCWSCLYLWMKAREGSGALCPLCKLPVSEDRIIPLCA